MTQIMLSKGVCEISSTSFTSLQAISNLNLGVSFKNCHGQASLWTATILDSQSRNTWRVLLVKKEDGRMVMSSVIQQVMSQMTKILTDHCSGINQAICSASHSSTRGPPKNYGQRYIPLRLSEITSLPTMLLKLVFKLPYRFSASQRSHYNGHLAG